LARRRLGVDALLGRQTREHSDLDVVAEPRLPSRLVLRNAPSARGYSSRTTTARSRRRSTVPT